MWPRYATERLRRIDRLGSLKFARQTHRSSRYVTTDSRLIEA